MSDISNPTSRRQPYEQVVFSDYGTADCLREAAAWIDDDRREPIDITFGTSYEGNPQIVIYVPAHPVSGGDDDD